MHFRIFCPRDRRAETLSAWSNLLLIKCCPTRCSRLCISRPYFHEKPGGFSWALLSCSQSNLMAESKSSTVQLMGNASRYTCVKLVLWLWLDKMLAQKKMRWSTGGIWDNSYPWFSPYHHEKLILLFHSFVSLSYVRGKYPQIFFKKKICVNFVYSLSTNGT